MSNTHLPERAEATEDLLDALRDLCDDLQGRIDDGVGFNPGTLNALERGQDAIAAWNRRVAPSPSTPGGADVERLPKLYVADHEARDIAAVLDSDAARSALSGERASWAWQRLRHLLSDRNDLKADRDALAARAATLEAEWDRAIVERDGYQAGYEDAIAHIREIEQGEARRVE